MNKKEISEIKKLFSPENAVITRICGCYVDGDKNVLCKSKEAFHALSEEDSFKYYDIFRQSLSGTLGKNLLNMDFPLNQEKEGGTQEFLLRLKESKLEDDNLVDEFYNKILENYDYGQNYYIILIHVVYDVPGKSTDGSEMFDSSDLVYDFIMCSICPVNLSKAGLGYHTDTNVITERVRDWVVEAPAKAFLFPVFNDRSSDLHSVLFYTKNTEDLQPYLIENVLGSVSPLSADTQKESFNAILTETLGEDCDYEVMKNIHENINELIEEHKAEAEPIVLTKTDVKHILEKSEVPDEKMETFDKDFEEIAGEKASFVAQNVVNTRKFNIETPDVSIKVNPARTDLVETRVIDGKECIVITVNERIEVNGVNVMTIKQNS